MIVNNRTNPCFNFKVENIFIKKEEDGFQAFNKDRAKQNYLSFIAGIQNIINDTDIPSEYRNKLLNDLKGEEGFEINPQKILGFALEGKYGVASNKVIDSLRENIKKNDTLEEIKVSEIYKETLLNKEADFRQKLSKSIKNEIVFEEKLNAEVPKGKNHIIKNINGKDVVVIKSLEGQPTDSLLKSVLSEHFSSVGFKQAIGEERYLGLVKNIMNSKDEGIKKLIDKHKGEGRDSTDLFNSIVLDLLEKNKAQSIKTYKEIQTLLNSAIRGYIPKLGRPFSLSELDTLVGLSFNKKMKTANERQVFTEKVKDKLKIKSIFGGDSYKGEKVNSFEGKKLREVVDKNTFKLMSEGVDFFSLEGGDDIFKNPDLKVESFVHKLNDLQYSARISGVDFGLSVPNLKGENLIKSVEKLLEKLRKNFDEEINQILKNKDFERNRSIETLEDLYSRDSRDIEYIENPQDMIEGGLDLSPPEVLIKIQDFIQDSKEYKNLLRVAKDYKPYLKSINRDKFDYQGITSIDELKQYNHQYKSIQGKFTNSVLKGLNKIDNRFYSGGKLADELILSTKNGSLSEPEAVEIYNIYLATAMPRDYRLANNKIGNSLEVELTQFNTKPSRTLTEIENIFFKVTEQNPLITLWIKAFNENKRALSPFKNEANNKLDVDTFKDLVLEYSMLRSSKFPVNPTQWLINKFKNIEGVSLDNNNINLIINAIKESDKSIIAFNKSLSLEVKNNEFSENTFEVIFDTAKVQALKPRLQKTYKKSIRKGFDETFNNDVEVIAEFERKGIDEKYYKDLDFKEKKDFLASFHSLMSSDFAYIFDNTNTSKLNDSIKESLTARAKGVAKETDTFVNDYKVIDKAVKKSYSDWLNKRVREDNISETALKSEADSILLNTGKGSDINKPSAYDLKDFSVKEASEYLHIYANKMARDKAHQKAYGHIEAVKGDILKDKKGNNIIDPKTNEFIYEGDLYLNNYFKRKEGQFKGNKDALKALKSLKDVHRQVTGTYGKGEENFLDSSMKRISQVMIMSFLGKNYEWAMVEGISGIAGLGKGGLLSGIKIYNKIIQNPVLSKDLDKIINPREFHSDIDRLIRNQFGDNIVDLYDKDILSTLTRNSQILNGNASLTDIFRKIHGYIAKSDLDRLLIEGDEKMLRIFNSMGISRQHIKELKVMLNDVPVVTDDSGLYGFAPSHIAGNSDLLEVYSKVLNTYIGNYSIRKTATSVPDFQQTGIGRFLLLFRSFEQSLYTAVSRSVRAGDERALNRIFWNTAGAAFLLSYRAGKYYNYERDGEDVAAGIIFNSGILGSTGILADALYQGFAKGRLPSAPLSVVQGLINEEGYKKIKPLVPYGSNPVVEVIDQMLP